MGNAFINSIIITSLSLVIIVLFSSMAAWALARTKTRMSKIIFYIFVAAMIVPFQAVMLPLVKWMSTLKLIGNYPGIIFMYLGFGSSMSIFYTMVL